MEYLESGKIIYHVLVIHSTDILLILFCLQNTMEISIRYNYYIQGDFFNLVGEVYVQTQIEYNICIIMDLVLWEVVKGII